MKKVKVKVKKLYDKSILPKYMNVGDAGADLFAYLDDDFILHPNCRCLISTGLSMAIPLGYEVQIRPRSGLAHKYGITVLNSPGTIDSTYRGEIKVILYNSSNENFVIKDGDRIAQMVLKEVPHADFDVVDNLDETERGDGGFGSTGK